MVIPGDLGITAIGQAGFEEVTSIVIPEGVTRIEDSAFDHREKLKKVTLPDSLRYIGYNAFRYCESLNNVVLPENVIVNSGAFSGCKALTDVVLPDSVVCVCGAEPMIDNWFTPFYRTPFENALLEAQKDDDFIMVGATLMKYQGSGGNVVLPANTRAINTFFVWSDQKTITSITYPKEMKQWIEDRIAQATDTHEEYAARLGDWRSSEYLGCSQLTEFVNAPVIGDNSNWNRYLANLEWERRQVDPSKCLGTPGERIKTQSNAIVAEAGAVTNYDKAKAIADWVAKNVKYDWDVKQNTKSAENAVTDPEQVLNGVPTTCDGYTKLTNQLLWAQEIPANYITGTGYGGLHAWTEAWINNRWVTIDTTWMAPFMNGTQTQGYEPKYFDIGIVELSESHAITDRPHAEAVPAKVAYASTQSVLVDGSPVEFQCYALKDANGNDTNYIKLRDVASVLNGTAVQFNVGWDAEQGIFVESGKPYSSEN